MHYYIIFVVSKSPSPTIKERTQFFEGEITKQNRRITRSVSKHQSQESECQEQIKAREKATLKEDEEKCRKQLK